MNNTIKNITTVKRENALLMRQSPKWLQFFGILMVALGAGIIGAGFLIRLDEVVTATGMLVAEGGREDVKTPVGGKIADVFVKNGERVQKGDLLIRFDTTQAKEQLATAEKLIELETKSLKRGISTLMLRKNTLQQRLKTQKETEASYASLAEFGGISRLQTLTAKDRVLELTNQITLIDEQRHQLEIESEKAIRSLKSQVYEAKQQLRYQNVKADTNGIIFDSQARVSGVLTSGSTILGIVPTDGLRAEVFVSNKDIGFIKEGQVAKVRVNAYPSNRYGELTGKVSLIGADSLPPDRMTSSYRFPVDISLDSDVLEREDLIIPLRSGMAITSNLIIRNKRAITLVSDFFGGQFDSLRALRGG